MYKKPIKIVDIKPIECYKLVRKKVIEKYT